MNNVALRLYDSDMTVEQIGAKTGMNTKYIQELITNSKNNNYGNKNGNNTGL